MWVRRYREAGTPGLEDRSPAPHPRRIAPQLERAICAVRGMLTDNAKNYTSARA